MTDTLAKNPALEKLCMMVYNADLGISRKSSFGAPGKFVSRGIIAATLYMQAVSHVTPVRNGKEAACCNTDIDGSDINWATVDALIDHIKTYEDIKTPMGKMHAMLQNAKSFKSASHISKAKHNSLCDVLQQIIASEKPIADVTADDVKVSDAPKYRDMVDYPAFGGIDIGYVAPQRGNKKAEEGGDSDEG